MNILVFDKKKKGLLGPKLSLTEYKCRCRFQSCSRTLVYTDTVKSFNKLRIDYGKPIRVNSAYRCQKHNERVGGHIASYHKVGSAMDLRPAADLYDTEELDILQELAEQCFDVVVRYESEGFIHCHNLVGAGEEI